MPRRLTGVGRRKTLTVADLDINDLTDLTCGWGPGWRGSRWATEEQFLEAYEELRDELLAHESARGMGPPFAEGLWLKRREKG